MVVNRLHTKLFETVARDMDRQIRSQFVEESLRPEYLKDFQRHLHEMVRYIETDVVIGGRMQWVKRLVKRLIRPHWQNQSYFNRMMIARLSEMNEDLKRLAVGSKELHTKQREDLERLAEKLRTGTGADFRPRRETGPPAATNGHAAPATRPIAAGAKLLLGTVAVKWPGYVHINPTEEGPADLSAPLDDLPVPAGTAAEVVIANALELFPAAEVRDRLLPYWATLLQPGGRLTIIADDLGAAVDRLCDGQIDFAELTEVLFGDGRQVRRSAYTPELLRQYVTEAGLADVSVTDRRQRPEAGAYGFELAAVRPRD
jgi:hypothetical protein